MQLTLKADGRKNLAEQLAAAGYPLDLRCGGNGTGRQSGHQRSGRRRARRGAAMTCRRPGAPRTPVTRASVP